VVGPRQRRGSYDEEEEEGAVSDLPGRSDREPHELLEIVGDDAIRTHLYRLPPSEREIAARQPRHELLEQIILAAHLDVHQAEAVSAGRALVAGAERLLAGDDGPSPSCGGGPQRS
jgi:hypothetical protein